MSTRDDMGRMLWPTIRGYLLPHVNEDGICKAMAGFPLRLSPEKDESWLANAVQSAMAITIPNIEAEPAFRIGNAAIRDELDEFAVLAWGAWKRIFGRSNGADEALMDFAYRRWEGSRESSSSDPNSPSNRLTRALAELEWLAVFVGQASRDVEPQKPNWRTREKRELRIERAAYLATIFEAAFATKVSANNFPSGKDLARTPFMDFMQRMFALAFNEHAIPDLAGIAKEVIRQHRQTPAVFEPGIVPGL